MTAPSSVLVESGLVEQRHRAVLEVLDGGATVTDVARRYSVSRQTVHRWLRSRPLRPRAKHVFKVTAKGRQSGIDARKRARIPHMLQALLVGSVLALGWFVLTISGLGPREYGRVDAVYGAAFFAVGNSALLVAAITRIRSARFAGERRASVRFDVRLPGFVEGRTAELRDLSVTGALAYVEASDTPSSERTVLTIEGPDGRITLACVVRRRGLPHDGRVELGLEFAEGQERQVARLALWLFANEPEPQIVIAPQPAAA